MREMDLDLVTTGILAGSSALVAALCGYMGARPPSFDRVRLIPWRFIMLLAATAAIVLGVHMLTLTGLKTDPPPRY